jgi:hypothetical protein
MGNQQNEPLFCVFYANLHQHHGLALFGHGASSYGIVVNVMMCEGFI